MVSAQTGHVSAGPDAEILRENAILEDAMASVGYVQAHTLDALALVQIITQLQA